MKIISNKSRCPFGFLYEPMMDPGVDFYETPYDLATPYTSWTLVIIGSGNGLACCLQHQTVPETMLIFISKLLYHLIKSKSTENAYQSDDYMMMHFKIAHLTSKPGDNELSLNLTLIYRIVFHTIL